MLIFLLLSFTMTEASSSVSVSVNSTFEEKLDACAPADLWTCQDYVKMVSSYGEQMEKVLSCRNYNKYVSPARFRRDELGADNATVDVAVLVEFKKIFKLDLNSRVGCS